MTSFDGIVASRIAVWCDYIILLLIRCLHFHHWRLRIRSLLIESSIWRITASTSGAFGSSEVVWYFAITSRASVRLPFMTRYRGLSRVKKKINTHTISGNISSSNRGTLYCRLLVSDRLVNPTIAASIKMLPTWKKEPKMPTSQPRKCAGATSAMYCGELIMADPNPSKNLPAINMKMFMARPWSTAAIMTTQLPA